MANAKKQQTTQAKEVPPGNQRASGTPAAKIKDATSAQAETEVSKKPQADASGAEQETEGLPIAADVNIRALDMLSLVGNINLHLNKAETNQQEATQSSTSTLAMDSLPLDSNKDSSLVPRNFIETSIETVRGTSEKTTLSSIKEEIPLEVDTTEAATESIQDKPVTEFAHSLQAAASTQQPLAVEPVKHMNAAITPRIGHPGWNQAIGQRVLWMVSDSIQSATLTLNPPDLGPVQVVLSVENDQANASFSTANPEVQQALESAMPKLRDMMESAGVKFGDATVSLGFSQQQSQPGKGDASQSASQTENSWNALGAEPEASIEPVARIVQGSGLINTFA